MRMNSHSESSPIQSFYSKCKSFNRPSLPRPGSPLNRLALVQKRT